MTELVRRRDYASTQEISKVADIREMVDTYHMPHKTKRHESPTKRLISLKNSAMEHKMMFKGVRNDLSHSNSQTYHIQPGQSYMVDA
jgi:hypothetical protein